MRRELGDWLRRRLRKGVGDQRSAVQEILDNCGVSITELQKQWAEQRATQLSIRARKHFNSTLPSCSLMNILRCARKAQERA